MLDTAQSLSVRLLEEGDRVVDFFNQLSNEQWLIRIYPFDNGWTFHNLLAHFVSAEIGRRELIVDILSGGRGAVENFDIDKFNLHEVEKFSGESNDTLLELFRRERFQLIELVSGLSDAELELVGNDPYLGMTALAEMIKLTYRHLQIHIREVRRSI